MRWLSLPTYRQQGQMLRSCLRTQSQYVKELNVIPHPLTPWPMFSQVFLPWHGERGEPLWSSEICSVLHPPDKDVKGTWSSVLPLAWAVRFYTHIFLSACLIQPRSLLFIISPDSLLFSFPLHTCVYLSVGNLLSCTTCTIEITWPCVPFPLQWNLGAFDYCLNFKRYSFTESRNLEILEPRNLHR